MDKCRALKTTSHVLSSMMLENPELEAHEPIRQVVVAAKNAAKAERRARLTTKVPARTLRHASDALGRAMQRNPALKKYEWVRQRIIAASREGR